jgi:hypothetical protein
MQKTRPLRPIGSHLRLCATSRAAAALHIPRAITALGMDVETPRGGMRPITAGQIALLASALLAPSALSAQAVSDTGCFAQPRVRGDSAARGRSAIDSSRARERGRGADVIVLASVSAREVRFQSQPQISVRLCGGFDSVRVVERRNLPERVVPGVTYRDVHVSVEILGHIYADCLRERLRGERPSACPSSTDSSRAAPGRPPR